MNLDKKTVLKILFIIFVSILFLVALSNIFIIFGWISKLISVLSPFILGLCLAFVINIPLKLIEEKAFARLNAKGGRLWTKLRRPISLLLSILVFVLIIALLLVIIIPQFKTSLEGFVTSLPSYMDALNEKLSSKLSSFTGNEQDITNIIDWQTISSSVVKFLHSKDINTIDMTVSIISGAITTIFNIVLGFVFSIYILASKERLGRQFRSLLYSLIKKQRVDNFLSVLSLANSSFYKFVVGQCTEAVIIGVLCAIGMLMFGMPYVPVISCIIALTALIPVFGAFIGTALGALIILLASPIKALWFIVYIIVLQQLETHIIYPKVMGKSVGLPGIWVLLAVTIGGGFFGAIGMLVSVPICSVIYTLLDKWISRRLIERNIDSKCLDRKKNSDTKYDSDN